MDTLSPSPLRRIRFIGCNERSDPLRGAAIFEALAEDTPEMAVVSRTLELEADRHGVYIILMPSSEAAAAMVELVTKQSCVCRVIVDVHADFWTPGAHVRGARDWWERDGHIGNLERCIKAADVVTVPSARYVDSVMPMNPRVAIVPDFRAGEQAQETETTWENGAEAWLEAGDLADQYRCPHQRSNGQ